MMRGDAGGAAGAPPACVWLVLTLVLVTQPHRSAARTSGGRRGGDRDGYFTARRKSLVQALPFGVTTAMVNRAGPV